MAEDDLHDLSCFCGEHAKAVVPETARDQELAVDRGHEAIGTYPHVLAEVVSQVAALGRMVRAVVRLGCKGTFKRD